MESRSSISLRGMKVSVRGLQQRRVGSALKTNALTRYVSRDNNLYVVGDISTHYTSLFDLCMCRN